MRGFSSVTKVVLLLVLRSIYAEDAFVTFRSQDGGRTWLEAGKGLLREARVNGFGMLRSIVLAATDEGIFVSKDRGGNWVRSETTKIPRPLCLASLGDTVFAGTDRGGLLVSNDEGKAWQVATNALRGFAIRSLLAGEGFVLAGTDGHGVFRSKDGVSWDDFGAGLPGHALVHQMAISDKTIFVALYSKGLYRRKETEGRWQKSGDVVPLVLARVGGAVIGGHNPGGLYRSVDNGDNWMQLQGSTSSDLFSRNLGFLDGIADGTVPRNAPVWAMASNSRAVFAGAADGVFYSEDQGRVWKRAVVGLPRVSPGVAFLADEGFVLATVIVKQ